MRSLGSACLAGALALALAACSDQSAPSAAGAQPVGPATAGALHTVQSAIGTTVGQSAAVSYVLAGARVFGTSPTPVTGSGTFDLRQGVGSVVLQQPSGRQLMVLTPTIVYTRVPPGGGAALPQGKSWMLASLTASESLATNFPQFVVQVEGFNPLLYLDEITWGAVSAAPLGSREMNGAPAEGYLVRADLARSVGRATSTSAASMALAIQSELTAAGTAANGSANPEVSVRLWIDGAGRVVTIEGSPPGAGVGTTTIGLSRFGVPVSVKPPVVSQVIDIASLTPSGERENNGGGDADGA